jgi:hypothetical protein
MSLGERLENLGDVPLKGLRYSIWWIRKTIFVKPPTPGPSVVVNRSAEGTTRLLGRNYFDPGWELSYYFHGEVLNLRRVEYVEDHTTGIEWWQVHVRGYDHPDGVALTAHFEPEPSEHPNAHVQQVGLDVSHGMTALTDLLEREGISYERGRIPRSASSPSPVSPPA